MTQRYSRLAGLAVTALVAVSLAMSTPGSAAPARTAVAHGPNGTSAAARYAVRPQLFYIGHGAGEPTLGITRRGEIFVKAGEAAPRRASAPPSSRRDSNPAPVPST